MIIDFHTHTFPKKIVAKTIDILSNKAHMAPFIEGTKEDLSLSMKKSRVDYSVTFSVATKESQVTALNDIAIANAGKEAESDLVFFGSMHPHFKDNEAELTRLYEAGVKGVKIHPVYQECPLDCPNFIEMFKHAAKLGIIVITHTGLDVGFPGVDKCGPGAARNVIEKVPDLKLVLAHMGGWKQWDEATKLLKDTPVMLDTSFSFGSINKIPGENYYSDKEAALLNKEEFVSMINVFGSERILFGTDSPWTDQSASIQYIEGLDLADTQKENILGKNAKKLLNL